MNWQNNAALKLAPRGGIVVNEKLQTLIHLIYAIGECALYNNMIYGLVAPGYEMADVIVSNLAAAKHQGFTGYDMSTKLKLIGVDVASFGDPFIDASTEFELLFIEDTMKGIYKRINITADGKQLLGGILVGDAAQYNMLLQTCKNKMVLPPNPEDVILGSRGGESRGWCRCRCIAG